MQRHDLGNAKVVPVILRQVTWDSAPFAKLQALVTGGKAVKAWRNLDAAMDDVARVSARLLSRWPGNNAVSSLTAPPGLTLAVS